MIHQAWTRLIANGPLPAQDTSGLWGYIDSSGNWTISPVFAGAQAFWSNGVTLAQDVQSQLWGLIDTPGQYVVNPTYDAVGSYSSDGLIPASVPGFGWGYIDTSGKIVIEPQFGSANNFSGGYTTVSAQTQDEQKSNPHWGYIDTSGKRITDDLFDTTESFRNGLACVGVGGIGGSFGYIDTNGNYAIEPIFDYASNFYDETAIVHLRSTGAWVMIDTDGNELCSPIYGTTKPLYSSGLFCVETQDKTGYVYTDMDGNIVLPKSESPYALAIAFFSDDLAPVIPAGSLEAGYIDKEGNWVISPQFLSAGSFSHGLAYVEIDIDKKAIIDTSGNFPVTLGPVYADSSIFLTPERILLKWWASDGTRTFVSAGYCSINDGIVFEGFDEANPFADDYSYASVKNEGLWGIIDKDGNWLIPAQFLAIAAA